MDILNKLQELYKELCQTFKGGLSNTSTIKFDPIRQLFSDEFKIPLEDIYAVGAGTRPGNLEVRLSQGVRATTHTKLGLTFIVDKVGTEENRNKITQSAFVTVEKFMGRGKSSYENILVIVDSNGQLYVTGLVHSEHSTITREIVDAFNINEVREVTVPAQHRDNNELIAPISKEQLIKSLKNGFIKYFSTYLRLSTGKCDETKIATYLSLYEKKVELPLHNHYPEFKSIFQFTSTSELNFFFSKVAKEYPEFAILLLDKWPEEKEKQTLYYVPWTMIRHYKAFLDLMGNMRNITLALTPKKMPFINPDNIDESLNPYLRAIRTKPFLLLAGISGTGKSRIVRQLAKSAWPIGHSEHNAHKPDNFEMIQVKPNWHDSSELIGYVSRIGNSPKFIAGDFLRFVAKAWNNYLSEDPRPYFLCLDEMNLAPVEQYFAEFLSVVESRKLQEDGKTVITDPLLKVVDEEWYLHLCHELAPDNEELQAQFLTEGVSIPQNLIVIGTVNMDETTYSFSRKVLDRAMTIEMNEVKLDGGLHKNDSEMPYIPADRFLADAVEGCDVYEEFKEVCDMIIDYLGKVNNVLEDTPFKIAYRTRNEFLLYVVNAMRLAGKDDVDKDTIAKALDEVTSMKILSRIEGDKRKVYFLDNLIPTIANGLKEIEEDFKSEVSIPKLESMKNRLDSGYTSFWD